MNTDKAELIKKLNDETSERMSIRRRIAQALSASERIRWLTQTSGYRNARADDVLNQEGTIEEVIASIKLVFKEIDKPQNNLDA